MDYQRTIVLVLTNADQILIALPNDDWASDVKSRSPEVPMALGPHKYMSTAL